MKLNTLSSIFRGILTLFIFTILLSGFALGQRSIQIGTGTNLSNPTLYGPVYKWGSYASVSTAKSITLYTAEELLAAGFVHGDIITAISHYKTNDAHFENGGLDYGVWMLPVYVYTNINEITLSIDDYWSSINSFTKVYTNPEYNVPNTPGWVTIELDEPWIFDEEYGFYILTSQTSDIGLTSNGSIEWEYTPGFRNRVTGKNQSASNEDNLSQRANIKFTVLYENTCEGTPDVGTIEMVDTPSNEVCMYGSFALAPNGDTLMNNLAYEWQSRIAGSTDSWTTVGTTGTYTHPEGVLTEALEFRLLTTCTTSNETTISNVLTIVIKPLIECYCSSTAPEFATNSIENIETIGGLSNIYWEREDYNITSYSEPENILTLKAGETFDMNIEGYGNLGVKMWVDWDKDLEFDETGELLAELENQTHLLELEDIEIPLGITPGDYVLRMKATRFGAIAVPCGEYENTTTFDFIIRIYEDEPCSGTPFAGTLIGPSEFSLCGGLPFQIKTENYSIADDMTYRWESRAAGSSDAWEDYVIGTTVVFPAETFNESLEFRFIVTCNNSGLSDTSEVVVANLIPPMECYCVPYLSSDYAYLDEITTTNGVVNLNYNISGYPEDGYDDQRHKIVSNYQGQNIDFKTYFYHITNSYLTPYYLNIWVDWNQDGVYEETELMTTVQGVSPLQPSFEIPLNTPVGQYPMRIIGSTLPVNPCGTYYNYAGTTVDFLLEVLSLPSCSSTPDAGVLSDLEVCENEMFQLVNSNSPSPSAGLENQWQVSVDGENWEDIVGATGSSYEIEDGIEETSYYRFISTCTYINDSDTSNVMTVTIKPITECYCIPLVENGSSYITEVYTTNAEQNLFIENDQPQFGELSYKDYSATDTLIIYANQEATVHIETNSGNYRNYLWVDWNNDGILSGNELMYNEPSTYGVTHTIIPPHNAQPGSYRARMRTKFHNSVVELDACDTIAYGYAIDFTLTIKAFDDCVGAPVAGTVVQDYFEICENESFTLEINGTLEHLGGIEGQWQSSLNGSSWVDVPGATDTIHTVLSASVSQFYRYVSTCTFDNNTKTFSDIITVDVTPLTECYCTPYNYNITRYVNSFETTDGVTNIDYSVSENPSASYEDKTDMIATLQYGESLSFTATVNDNANRVRIWVDWNDNGIFEEDEMMYDWYKSGLHGSSFSAPEYAVTGPLRMRIRSRRDSGNLDPCTEYSLSSTVDFTLHLLPYDDCEGTPVAGNVSDMEVCTNNDFELLATGVDIEFNGLEEQWQYSLNGDDWFDVPGANTYSYTVVGGISVPTYYRHVQTCTATNSSVFSDAMLVSLTLPEDCYCDEEFTIGCEEDDNISLFYLEGQTVDINNSSGCSEDGYGDFTGIAPADLVVGETYSITVETDGGMFAMNSDLSIWIDYNDNGIFETNELIAATHNTGLGQGSVSFQYTVPVDVPEGLHRLRVKLIYNMASSPDVNACEVYSWGEAEDYMVHIIQEDCETISTPSGFSLIADKSVICGEEDVNLSIYPSMGGNGMTFIYESSTDEINWVEVDGLVENLSEDTYFRGIWACNNQAKDTTESILITTLAAEILSTEGAESCGGSALTLNATSTPQTEVYWYDNVAGLGLPLHIGEEFETPFINETTSYWVSALGELYSHSNSLQTTTLGYNGCSEGVMFNVIPSKNIKLDSLIANKPTNAHDVTVGVYYRVGGYQNYEDKPYAWTYLESVSGDETNNYLSVILNNSLVMEAGVTYGIYLDYPASVSPVSSHQTFTNDEVSLISGVSLCTTSNGDYPLNVFRGEIFYSVKACNSELVEVVAEIIQPGSIDHLTLELCSQESIDLNDYLTVGLSPDGTWYDGEANELTSTTIDFASFDDSFVYVVESASSCGHDSLFVDIEYESAEMGVDTQFSCGDFTWIDGNTYTQNNNTATYMLTTAAGCDSIVKLNLLILDTPNPGHGEFEDLCFGETIDLNTLLAGNPDTGGFWYDPDGSLLNSSVVTVGNEAGVYIYTYVVYSGTCSDSTTVQLYVEECEVSIDVEVLNDLSVYPNPTTKVVNINNPSNHGGLKLELLDMNGRRILIDETLLKNSDKGTLNIEYLEKGVYTLRIFNTDGQKIFKIVKQ